MAEILEGKNDKKKQVSFRVLDKEFQQLLQKSSAAGISVPKFCKRASLGKKIATPNINLEVAHQLASDLRKIGSNINQTVKYIHANKDVSAEDLKRLDDKLGDIWRLFNSAILNK